MGAINELVVPDGRAAGENPELSGLFSAAYSILRQLARAQRRRGHGIGPDTLSTTALVHEAYLKLSQQHNPPHWESRGHFFGIAARAMRHILIDYAHQKQTLKRGGNLKRVPLERAPLVDDDQIDNLLALDDALNWLERYYPRQARVVECRFFAGLNVKETAEALDISPTTIKRDWRLGQAKLFRMMNEGTAEN